MPAAMAASFDMGRVSSSYRVPSRRGTGYAGTNVVVPSWFRSGEEQFRHAPRAALLQRVADAVTKVGGNVLSSQVDVQGVQAKEGYVSVLASCELDYAALQRLLYDLDAGMPGSKEAARD